MIEVKRQNGINNRQGIDRANKVFQEFLIADYSKQIYLTSIKSQLGINIP